MRTLTTNELEHISGAKFTRGADVTSFETVLGGIVVGGAIGSIVVGGATGGIMGACVALYLFGIFE